MPSGPCSFSDCGSGFSMYNGLCVNRRSDDLLRRPDGVIANFRINETHIPFTRCADYYSKAVFSAEFFGNYVKFTSKLGFFDCAQTVGVFSRTCGEQRVFSIRNNTKSIVRGVLGIYFEPSLSRDADERAHPAFLKMFIDSYYDKENEIAVFCRKSRTNGETVWLAAGFFTPLNHITVFDRESVLERPNGIFSLADTAREKIEKGGSSVE
ncbi:MAG: hypothetical protein ACOX45_01780 [Acutalibacteraceae bacterium]